ncbi:MAG: hypothetical protein HC888_13090 [Candidatus Competibacteraceae bacterium]|nr:hypothetical protein [Candidatus Competibacteraceae bacterium]
MGGKTVNLSEIDTTSLDGVGIEGTVGTVNLITDITGDIYNSAALDAGNGIFQTFDGDILLDDPANTVDNFRGVAANDANADGTGGNFVYLGAADVTVLARAASAEIPGG